MSRGPRIRRLAFGAAGASMLFTSACGSSTVTAKGVVGLTGDSRAVAVTSNGCQGSGGWSDIVPGADVTIYNENGTIVGSGSLGPGTYSTKDGVAVCVLPFSVNNVKKSSFYQVEVTHRGKVSVQPDRIRSIAVGLTQSGF